MANEIQEQFIADTAKEVAKAVALAVSEAAVAREKIVAGEGTATAVAIAELKVKLEMLETQQNGFVSDMKKQLEELFNKINEIIACRPSWIIAWALGGLMSLCVGLIVYITTK